MRVILCILLLCSNFLLAQKSDTLYYSVVTAGKTVGKQTSWKSSPNELHYHYEFNDRGRGPSINATIKTADNGSIIFQEYNGVDYFKTAVKEKFEVRKNKAYWKNKFENDSAVFKGQLYSNINGTPAEAELNYQLLNAAPGNKISILPSGYLSLIKGRQVDVADSAGNKVSVQMIGFTGLGGPPYYIWFTRDGRYFGNVNEWSSIIKKGFEKTIDQLLPIQKEIESEFYKKLAIATTEKNEKGIAIKNVTVFNAAEGSTFIGATVLIKNGLIEKKGNSSTPIPAGYKIIDGTNKFLMPGLWEMHGHFFKEDGPLMLARGVTNLRDMGNSDELWNVKAKVEADSLLGPEINVISGFIDKAGEFAAPTGALINSLEEGLKYIDDYHKKGCTQIKLYSSLNPEWVKPMADKAHALGMRVCGHIPAFMTASQAIDAGYDEVTHLNMLLLNFFGDTVDTRNMTRFKLPGTKGYTIDLNSAAVKSFIQKLVDKKIVVDPTINIFENMFTELPGKLSNAYIPVAKFLPAETKRFAMSGGFIDDEKLAPLYAKSYATMKKMIKLLYDNGVVILSGTDGGILQHELEIYSECGIPNYDILRMATYWPAYTHKLLDRYGTIDEGKVANLILIDGDPKKNIKDIRKIYLTIKEGKMYSPKKIYAAYGWGYYY